MTLEFTPRTEHQYEIVYAEGVASCSATAHQMRTANDGTVHRLPEPSFRLAAQQCIGGIGAGVRHWAASPGRNITYASTPNDFKPREPYGDRLQSDGSAAVRPVRAGPLGLSMSHKQSAMQVYYAARASEYELIYLKPERQTDLRAIEHWLPPKFAGARVIEVACGTGYWTRFIAPVASRVLALDTAPETMSIAKTRVPEGKVDFLVGDAYALPRHVGRFDAAFAGFWFSHVPKTRRREFLLGLAARLEPGATVVFLDNLDIEGSSSPVTARDAEGNTFQTRQLGDGSTHKVLKNFPSEAELLDLVLGLGERPVFTTWQYYWAFEYLTTGPDDSMDRTR